MTIHKNVKILYVNLLIRSYLQQTKQCCLYFYMINFISNKTFELSITYFKKLHNYDNVAGDYSNKGVKLRWNFNNNTEN